MRCPHCSHLDDRVIDSRLVREGRVIRRRRECASCQSRFTTYEELESSTPVIVKKDGRRQAYSREKLMEGLMAACQKRPVSMDDIEEAVHQLEARLFDGRTSEVPSGQLGEGVMDFLKHKDAIAYIRFASVYRSFNDLHEFLDEIQDLVDPNE
ncbi:MAG: transcriptional repressor NrdR [Myxococcota bacterium]|jgi:transcriptional repressor NrdR